MSSYLVLARKYRPRTFGEVIGQDVVTGVLRGALEDGRIGHAYLFSGPRGTGKTTLARIFAKCLNCEKGPKPDPCGECERCLGAEAGSEPDVIELDAASHTGVDTIRELRDEAIYAPMRARRKIYIIDEVHMLSKGAFNALLKILEEPPAHVCFLFATTEPHKVLDTILSRCQILRLSPIPEEKIVARLDEVFAAEGVRAEPGVTLELARSARGGMRDALSQADKLLALVGDEPTLEGLRRLGGQTGGRALEELLAHVESGNRPALLAALSTFEGDETELVDRLLEDLRAAALLAYCGESTPLVTLQGEERANAKQRGERLGAERIELWMQECLAARERMRLLPAQERTILELCLLDLAQADTTLPLADLVQRLEALEARLDVGGEGPARASAASASAAPQASPSPKTTPQADTGKGPDAVPQPSAPTGTGTGLELASLWEPLLEELARNHGALAGLLRMRGAAERIAEREEGTVRIALKGLAAGDEKLVADRRNRSACGRVLTQLLGRTVQVEFDGASSAQPTPAKKVEKAAGKKTKDKKADGFTREVADLFGGVIEDLG